MMLFFLIMIQSFFNEDSGNVGFSSNEMGILNVDVNDIDLDDANFDEDDRETIIHVSLMAQLNTFRQHKARKKIEVKN